MAKDFKQHLDFLKSKDTEPLNDIELRIVKDKEDFIDSEIEERFSTDSKEIYFDYTKVKISNNKMTNARAKFLEKELFKRFEDAGWEIKIEYDDGFGGGNTSTDWVILTGKIK